jgi:hypothetical protein
VAVEAARESPKATAAEPAAGLWPMEM